VLEALPANVGRGYWLTPSGLAMKLEIPELVACSVLAELHSRRLVEADVLYPPAFARTLWGDIQLAGRRFEKRRTNVSRSKARR
jgi:hypothetical protein